MLIITNRNINESNFKYGVGDHGAFGDGVNSKGPNEVRLAYANKKNGKWKVKLVKEVKGIGDKIPLPSQIEFAKLRKNLAGRGRNCVFYIHGFNQSFEKNLEQCLKIEIEHGIEIIAFSWPSNPGGFVTKEYRHAKRAARASVGALDATLEKLGAYLKEPFNKEALRVCNTRFSLMCQSLGNYLFQHYIIDSAYENETSVFDNVVLCQADVDHEDHAEWVGLIETGKRVYITLNENDFVLKWSDVNFQKARLGRTAKNLESGNSTYFDFTDGEDVGNTHALHYKTTNDVVKNFFTTVLNGGRGESVPGMTYDERSNSYRF